MKFPFESLQKVLVIMRKCQEKLILSFGSKAINLVELKAVLWCPNGKPKDWKAQKIKEKMMYRILQRIMNKGKFIKEIFL